MLTYGRDIELLRQIDCGLTIQYEELLCLRAEVARLLFPLKISPPRKNRTQRRNRSDARTVKRTERRAS
jgi:hypothetical protein